MAGVPFAGYHDHADCVRKNRDKRDPDAYCATIERSVRGQHALVGAAAQSGEWVTAVPLKADAGDGILPGGTSRPSVTGVLSVIRSDRTGIQRWSVNGQTIDPATVETVNVPEATGPLT